MTIGTPTMESLERVAETLARYHELCPMRIRDEGKTLEIAVGQSFDVKTLEELERLLEFQNVIIIARCTKETLDALLTKGYGSLNQSTGGLIEAQ